MDCEILSNGGLFGVKVIEFDGTFEKGVQKRAESAVRFIVDAVLMSPMIAFRSPMKRYGTMAFLALANACTLWGQDSGEPTRSDAIVSEKDAVDLLDDSTVSEAISRRPDLSFSNVTIDGEDSRRSLDSISADSVSSVEVLKAATSDQDAESRGGSIRLKTRPGYEQAAISTKISLGTSYESLRGDFGQEASLSIGGPLNKGKTLGGRLSLGFEKYNGGQEYTIKDWYRRKVDGESALALKELRVYDVSEWNTTLESSASLDVKVSDALRLYWRGSYQTFTNEENKPHYEYRLKEGTYDAIDERGAHANNVEIEQGFHAFEAEEKLLESSIGGEWERGDWEADFMLTYQDERYAMLDHLNLDFVQSGVDVRYDLDNPLFPTTTITNGKEVDDAEAYLFEDFSIRNGRSNETDTIAASNVRWNHAFGNEHLSMRFGLKSRVRDEQTKTDSSYYEDYRGAEPFTMASVLSKDSSSDVLMGNYHFDVKVDKALVKSFVADRFDSFSYDERRSRERSDATSHQVDEQVDAIYGMLDFEWGKWRTLFGLRQENTAISFVSAEVVLGIDEFDKDGDGDLSEVVYLRTNPTTGSTRYGNAFPNGHIGYKLNDRTSFIASYTDTIKRPLYGAVVPYRQVNLEDRRVEEGNPDLRPTLYGNLDLSMDVRIAEEGLVSLELFDRTLDDYIFNRESTVSGGLYEGFELRRQENSSNAHIQGASLSWIQPIALPILPEGLSFNANYQRQETELNYPERPGEVLSLARQPDSSMKVSLRMERKKLFAQLTMEQEEESIYRVGSKPEEDRYYAASSRLDLALSYQLRKKTRWYVEWNNITNEPNLDLYEGSPSRSSYYRYRPWTVNTGMKLEL